jgi:hypothetical protein
VVAVGETPKLGLGLGAARCALITHGDIIGADRTFPEGRWYGRIVVGRGWDTLVVAALATGLALSAPAAAHIERAPYWPDPAPDASISPAAGGAVPVARSLASALRREPPGSTHVVCKPDSLARGLHGVDRARRAGIRLRPSQPAQRMSRAAARRHRALLRRFARRCRFAHIQEAVLKASNHDRIVVMPGVYREEPSREHPKNDPRCADQRTSTGAATYAYQVKCPNDQSLIFVQGRAVSAVPPPEPPRDSRFGIPDAGPCVRCNLQIEGAGAGPRDVIIDAGKDPAAPLLARTEASKDVGLRADRADGFVLRNLTIVHARESGVYVNEADGYLLDDFASLYNGQYGTLTFATDHGLTSDCDLAGHSDSGAYPGGAPDTVAQRTEPAPRLNQAITRCDLHHNAAGYSASMGNGIHIHGNDVYDNVTGIFTSSSFPGGHPGYPQDGAVIEDNDIHANNFDAYAPGSDVRPIVPVPIGVGVLIIGGNDNQVLRNRIWDNWLRGAMQVALPDVLSDYLTTIDFPGDGINGSTSHRNHYTGNVMGVAPDGSRAPNGLDFWWDESPGEQGNCWYGNGTVTTDPRFLPATCHGVSLGLTYPQHAAELVPCLAAGTQDDSIDCPWYRPPARPAARVASPSTPRARRAGALPRPQRIGRASTAADLQVAACRDWLRAPAPARRGVVDRLEQIIRGERGQGRTPPDAVAAAAISARCGAGRRFDDFLLYPLYAMAAGFAVEG